MAHAGHVQGLMRRRAIALIVAMIALMMPVAAQASGGCDDINAGALNKTVTQGNFNGGFTAQALLPGERLNWQYVVGGSGVANARLIVRYNSNPITNDNVVDQGAVPAGSSASGSYVVTAIGPVTRTYLGVSTTSNSQFDSTSNVSWTVTCTPVSSGPAVTSIAPASGSAGTAVTITGSGLTNATAVRFGATAASGYTVYSATQIVATAPAGSGTVNVTVTTASGTSATGSGSVFTYTAAAPVASARSASVAYNSATAIDLSSSISGSHSGIAISTAAAHGTTSIAGDVVTYTPTSGYSGGDSFAYTATGPVGTSAPATVTITVAAPTIGLTPSAGALPGATQGTAYSQSVTASGGASPYGYALTAGALPTGLTLSTAGALSGTPTQTGDYSFTISATDANGATGSASYTLRVAVAAPVAGNASATVAANSNANPVTLNLSGGTATSIAIGNAPTHGSVSVSGTSVTYTPAAGYAGPDSFTYTATNGSGTSAPGTVSITVTAPTLSVAPASLPAGTAGVAYSQTLSASGGTAPYSYAVTAGVLPNGLTLSTGGSLSGTPKVSGTFNLTITATDASGFTASRGYTLTVATPTLSVTPASLPAGTAGVAYSQALSTSGGTAPYSYAVTAGASPNGLTLTTGGSLSGTPTVAGNFNLTITATDASGFTASRGYTLTIAAPTLSVAPASLPAGTVGVAYSQSLSTSGGTAPYSYAVTAGALPNGLTLTTGGSLSGTPSVAGTFNLTITATDASGFTAARSYTLSIAVAVPVAADSNASVAANSSGNAIALSLSGGSATALTIVKPAKHGTATVSGTTISYTPDAGYSGGDSFLYTADNASGSSAPAAVSITVTAPTLTLSPATLTAGTKGVAYSQTLSAQRGTAPYSYAVTAGALPAGLTLSGAGSLSGTPTTSGSFTVAITATDALGASGTASYTIAIADAAPVAGNGSATVAANSAAAPVALNLSGGAATSVAVTGQPAHGTATASGTGISYMPTAGYAGPDSFAYTATNGSGTSAPATISITVTAPTLAIAPTSLPGGTAGVAYSQSLSASGGSAPYSYAVTAGALPSGLVLSTGGSLSGTPMVAGNFNLTIMATDATGFTASRSYTLTIGAAVPVAADSNASVAANSNGNAIALSLSGGTATSITMLKPAKHGVATVSGTSVSYTPEAGYAGGDSFTYSAGNGSGTSSPATVSITVTAPTLSLSPASLPGGTIGVGYGQSFAAKGGTAPYSYAVSAGALPSGLTLSTAGALSGTPSREGTFGFTVTGTDASGFTVAQAYSIAIAEQAPKAGASSTGVAANSADNALTLNLSGGKATSVAVTGQPAHGSASVSGLSILYTPAAGFSGSDSVSYTATNGAGTSAPATVAITVAAPTLAITPAKLDAGTQGVAYRQALTTSGGGAPYGYAVTGGSLPAGLSLASDGTLSGTPGAVGRFAFTVTVTDAHGATGSASYELTIAVAAPVAGPVALKVDANSAAAPVALALSGGEATSVAVASQPAHGTATVSGMAISYAPAAGYSGSDSFTYTATNASGTSAAATVSVTVTQPTIELTPATLPGATVGVDYGATLSANGGAAPYRYRVTGGSLPVGITLNAGGVLSGSATTEGRFTFMIAAEDAHGAAGTRAYAIDVAVAAPVAGATSLSVAANSSDNAVPLDLSGGKAQSVAIASTPAHGTATVSGTGISYAPVAGYSGNDSFTYTATNASGTSAAATVTVTVTAPTLVVGPAAGALPGATVGSSYGQRFTATGGAAPYAFALSSGQLPAGLSLGTDGTLSGTAKTSGDAGFAITATDAHGATGTTAYTIHVMAQAPDAGDASVTVAANSSDNAVALNLSGGAAASVAVVGQAQHGVATASGTTIGYTPAAGFSGSDRFTYTATNAGGTSAPATVTVTVTAPTLAVTPAMGALPAAQVGADYRQSLSVSGGTAPYRYAVADGALPAGVTLGEDGTLAGRPTGAGSHGFTVTVTDANGASGKAAYTIVAGVQAPTAGAVRMTVAANSAANPVVLDLGGGAATGIAIASQPAHGVASLSGDTISYAPAAGYSGEDSFTYTATNAAGTSQAATVTVTVQPPIFAFSPASGALPAATAGTPYDAQLAASGGAAPYRFAASDALPGGLTLSADGRLAGTPAAGGSFAFGIVATDANGATSSARYTLEIAVPAAPVARDPALTTVASSTVASGSTADVDLTSLVTGDYDDIRLVELPAHGVVTLQKKTTRIAMGGSPFLMAAVALAGVEMDLTRTVAVYTPNAGYHGTDSFRFVAVGPGGTSAPATVTLNVVGPAPTARALAAQTTDNRTVSVDLTGGLSDGPFTAATIVSMTPADAGTARIVETGSAAQRGYRLDVTPRAHFGGRILVAYTLANGFGTSAPATVTITVTARPDPSADPTVRAISDAQAETTRRFSRAQVDNFMRRAEALHGDGQGRTAMGIRIVSTDGGMAQDRPVQAGAEASAPDRAIGSTDAAPEAGGASGEAREAGQVAIWTGGAIQVGTQDATGRRAKIRATTSGLSGGADLQVAPGATIGIGGGYGRDVSRIAADAGKVTAENRMVAAYASVSPMGGLFVDGMVGRGWLSFDTQRVASGNDRVATGSRDGTLTVGSLAMGIDRTTGEWRWSFYGRGDYLVATLDGYREEGADIYDLRFDRRRLRSMTGTLGGRIAHSRAIAIGVLTGRLRGEWAHEFHGAGVQGLDYADVTGASAFGIGTAGWTRDQFQLSPSLSLLLPSAWRFDLEVGLGASAGQRTATTRVQVTKQF